MSWPPMRAVPSVGSRIPQSIRITVDLPEPFGPRKPKIDPLPTLNETWSTAVNVPKRFVRPSHSIIVSMRSNSRRLENKHPPPCPPAIDRHCLVNESSRRIPVESDLRLFAHFA